MLSQGYKMHNDSLRCGADALYATPGLIGKEFPTLSTKAVGKSVDGGLAAAYRQRKYIYLLTWSKNRQVD